MTISKDFCIVVLLQLWHGIYCITFNNRLNEIKRWEFDYSIWVGSWGNKYNYHISEMQRKDSGHSLSCYFQSVLCWRFLSKLVCNRYMFYANSFTYVATRVFSTLLCFSLNCKVYLLVRRRHMNFTQIHMKTILLRSGVADYVIFLTTLYDIIFRWLVI
jgi:hypothetical protein